MSIWKLTLPAMEQYLNEQNDSLFADIVLPSGMDKTTLVSAILDDSDFYNVLYQDANFMKAHITNWFKKYLPTFTKWYELWNTDYNPLENYNRTEKTSDVKINTQNDKDGEKAKSANLHNGAESANGENVGKVSAYDEDGFNNKDQNISSDSQFNMASDNGKSERDHNGLSGGTEIFRHKNHTAGNIGVMSSQELYERENALREQYNPYTQITDLFLTEFVIMVL